MKEQRVLKILTHAKSLETSFIESTAFVWCTGGHADAVTALQGLGAVGGGVAGAGDPHALHLGVAGEVLGADALLAVPGDAAVGVQTTGPLGGAGVHTPASLAHLAGAAVAVRGAGLWKKKWCQHQVDWLLSLISARETFHKRYKLKFGLSKIGNSAYKWCKIKLEFWFG